MTSLADQCQRLAGALAEHSIAELELHPPSPDAAPDRLVPGQTDLPGALLAAPPGSRLAAPTIGLLVERAPHSLTLLNATTDTARAIAHALGA